MQLVQTVISRHSTVDSCNPSCYECDQEMPDSPVQHAFRHSINYAGDTPRSMTQLLGTCNMSVTSSRVFDHRTPKLAISCAYASQKILLNPRVCFALQSLLKRVEALRCSDGEKTKKATTTAYDLPRAGQSSGHFERRTVNVTRDRRCAFDAPNPFIIACQGIIASNHL